MKAHLSSASEKALLLSGASEEALLLARWVPPVRSNASSSAMSALDSVKSKIRAFSAIRPRGATAREKEYDAAQHRGAARGPGGGPAPIT